MPIVRELFNLLGWKVDQASLQQANRAMSQVQTRMGSAAGQAQQFGQQLGASIRRFIGLAALYRVGRGLLDVNVTFERLAASLRTVTGSARAAEEAFSFIQRFTSETPFQLENVTEAFIQFRAVGLSATEETMRAVGDLASAFGRDITEATQAIVSASYGEAEALKRFGILARFEQDRVSVTFDGVTQTISRDAATVQEHLLGLARQRYAGQMALQMSTLGGIISNLKDQITLFARRVGEAGFADAMREFIGALRDAVGGGESTAEVLGKVLGGAIRLLTRLLRVVLRLMPLIKVGLAGLVASRAISGIARLSAGVVGLIRNLMSMRTMIMGLVFLIPLLIEDFVTWLRGGESVIGRLLGGGGEGARDWILNAIDWLTNRLSALFGWITDGVANMIGWLAGLLSTFFGWINDAVTGIADVLDALDIAGMGNEIADIQEEIGVLTAQQSELARQRRVVEQQRLEGWEQVSAQILAQEEALGRRMRSLQSEADTIQSVMRSRERLREGEIIQPGVFTGPGPVPSFAPSSSMSVGEVNVAIQGSTGMGAEEVRTATAAGVTDALQPMLEQTGRRYQGSGRLFD